MKVFYRPKFDGDIEEIIVNLAREASERVALRWRDGVRATVERIVQNPGRGHPRPDLKPDGLRAGSVVGFESYLVFYRWAEREEVIEFFRVKHGGMNLLCAPPNYVQSPIGRG